MSNPVRRVQIGIGLLALVVLVGTVGFMALGYSALDSLFQTVETVSTVGFGTPANFGTAGKVFTMCLILVGVGTALYTFTVTLEVLIEGHMRDLMRRRRMDRDIERMTDHVVVCGWGRVGREVARYLDNAGRPIVVLDRDAGRLAGLPHPTVIGDVTEDATLLQAGIERASTLVAALDTDADNLYVTVAGRSFRPDLHIIARARGESSEAKLLRAGADRVVNPQRLGGDRMAAFVTQPHVVDFIDVVMHDGTLEFRLEEITVAEGSPLNGASLRSVRVHDRTGALVLAIRRPDGSFTTNPPPELEVSVGDVLIGIGTADQLESLSSFASGKAAGAR